MFYNINHFKNNDVFFVFWTDYIKFFDIKWNSYFLIFHAFNLNFYFIKIDYIFFLNVQDFQNSFIIIKSFFIFVL